MKQIRSKKLRQYLNERGALNGTEEEIAAAKAEYRRLYKREWKKSQQMPKKELRPGFTLKQYKELQLKARELNLSPTSLLKDLALGVIDPKHIPNSDQLLTILQLISMSAIEFSKKRDGDMSSTELLQKAEQLLIHYLNR